MKKFLRNMVLAELNRMAKRRLKKFKGKVIAVTGSVGKTTSKDAIFTVLNSRFRVKRSEKSMNSDFGLPLTILEIPSGFSSAIKWSWLLFKGWVHSYTREHADVLLVELGVDQPGDMTTLTKIVKPDIAVFTGVNPTHLDKENGQFGSLQEIFEEKSKLVASLRDGGVAILNLDNKFTATLAKTRGRKNTVTYSCLSEADFWVEKVAESLEGIGGVLNHNDKKYEIKAPILGAYHFYSILPAIACAVEMKMSVEEAILSLQRMKLAPGRLNPIEGKNGVLFLDGSYNASPEAVIASLGFLARMANGRRKIAVLGSMNELGMESEKFHRLVGREAAEIVDVLVCVGKEAEIVADEARASGLSENLIFTFKSAAEAAKEMEEKFKKGDIILVKGSQNKIRLENFIKPLMLNPAEAKDLLARQEKEWHQKI